MNRRCFYFSIQVMLTKSSSFFLYGDFLPILHMSPYTTFEIDRRLDRKEKRMITMCVREMSCSTRHRRRDVSSTGLMYQAHLLRTESYAYFDNVSFLLKTHIHEGIRTGIKSAFCLCINQLSAWIRLTLYIYIYISIGYKLRDRKSIFRKVR